MSEWKEYKLGDIITLNYGKSLPVNKRNNGDIPVYSSAGLTGWNDKALVNSKGLIVGRKGSIGKIYKSETPFFPIDTSYFVLPDNDIYDFDFLFYLLGSIGLDELNEDSAVPGLNRNTVYSQLISLPPLPEQKAIASVLSSLDDKIDLLHQQNKTLEAMAETLFRQWFVEDAKDDWEAGCLDDIADVNPTYQLKKGLISTYLEMKNLSNTNFNPENWCQRKFTSGMKFHNGDTLLARITPCLENGKTCFVTFLEDKEIGWGSTEYIVLRMKEPFHPYISYIIAKDKDFRDFAISSMTGSSGRQRAQANVIKKYDITIPPSNIIEQLNNHLAGITFKLKINANQIRTLEKLRDTLLPKLMSGEVRVSI